MEGHRRVEKNRGRVYVWPRVVSNQCSLHSAEDTQLKANVLYEEGSVALERISAE